MSDAKRASEIEPRHPRIRPAYAVDTNVLVRLFQADAEPEQSKAAQHALAGLLERGHVLYITPLILIEFWSIATRNIGLKLSIAEASERLTDLEAMFAILSDTTEVHTDWKELIKQHRITGPDSYDAYIAATLRVHSIPRLLTFNTADFRRFSGFRVVHPREVQPPSSVVTGV